MKVQIQNEEIINTEIDLRPISIFIGLENEPMIKVSEYIWSKHYGIYSKPFPEVGRSGNPIHKSFHGDIAENHVKLFNKKDDDFEILILTHSENYILRMRTMVAEELLSHEDIGFYYFKRDENTKNVTIILQELNELGEWKEGLSDQFKEDDYFGSTLKETTRLRDAIRKREGLVQVDGVLYQKGESNE